MLLYYDKDRILTTRKIIRAIFMKNTSCMHYDSASHIMGYEKFHSLFTVHYYQSSYK